MHTCQQLSFVKRQHGMNTKYSFTSFLTNETMNTIVKIPNLVADAAVDSNQI